jgi:hypothetical protein
MQTLLDEDNFKWMREFYYKFADLNVKSIELIKKELAVWLGLCKEFPYDDQCVLYARKFQRLLRELERK